MGTMTKTVRSSGISTRKSVLGLLICTIMMCSSGTEASNSEEVEKIVETVVDLSLVAISAGVSIAFPPAAPFVIAAATILGMSFKMHMSEATRRQDGMEKQTEEQKKKAAEAKEKEELQRMHQLFLDKLDNMTDILTEINGTLAENRQQLISMEQTLLALGKNLNGRLDRLQIDMSNLHAKAGSLKDMESLWLLMKTAISANTTESLNWFVSHYKHVKSGTALMMDIVGYFTLGVLPIELEMNQDIMKSQQIMNKYLELFGYVIFKTITIEGFYHGATSSIEIEEDVAFMKSIEAAVKEAMNSVVSFFRNHSLKLEAYWPQLVQNITAKNMGQGDLVNTAEKIVDELNKLHTLDIFSVTVYRYDDVKQLPRPLVCKKDFESARNLTMQRYDAKLEVAKGYMIAHYDAPSKTYAVVLRSTQFMNMHSGNYTLLRNCFRSFINHMAWMKKITRIDAYYEEEDPLTSTLRDIFEPNFVRGFTATDIDPVVRYTQNMTPILADYDLRLFPAYYGLIWG